MMFKKQFGFGGFLNFIYLVSPSMFHQCNEITMSRLEGHAEQNCLANKSNTPTTALEWRQLKLLLFNVKTEMLWLTLSPV